MPKIAVIGSRNFKDSWKVFAELANISESGTESFQKSLTIISGGATGVDTWAEKAVMQYGLNFEEYKPDFKLGIPACYHIRNDKIIHDAWEVIAFWDGESKGTKSVIDKCIKQHKNVRVIF